MYVYIHTVSVVNLVGSRPPRPSPDPKPGVRGAVNRVWGASTASTVRLGKNFIKQKL